MEKYHPPCVNSEVVTEFSKPQVSVFMRTASFLGLVSKMLRRAPSAHWQARGEPECHCPSGEWSSRSGKARSVNTAFVRAFARSCSFSFVLGGLCLEVTFAPLCGFKLFLIKTKKKTLQTSLSYSGWSSWEVTHSTDSYPRLQDSVPSPMHNSSEPRCRCSLCSAALVSSSLTAKSWGQGLDHLYLN